MTNPVSQFRNNIFGSRGCNIQEAVDYANELINTLQQTDQVGIRVGLGVLINTIDNAVAQSQGPSPERLAILELIDARLNEWATLKLRDRVMEIIEDDDISDQISDWMSNNFDIDDYNVEDSIERWVENNLDEKVSEAVNNLEFSVTLK